MNNNFSVGKRLRELRTERALSQEQVANTAEITSAYYGQLERELKNATVRTLEKICNVFDISLAEFFNPTLNNDNKEIDEISYQILHQLTNKSDEEKQAILNMIKMAFRLQDMK